MARHENDDVSHIQLPNPAPVSNTYNMENGAVINDEQFNSIIQYCKTKATKPPAVCARAAYNSATNMSTYYILCAGGQLFDPKNKDSRYRIRNRWKLVRVKKSTYDLYLKFLKTNHNTFLHQAEREI